MLSLTGMSKSLPKTPRGREERGELNRVPTLPDNPSRDKVMKNKTNKRRLGELLCTHNIGDHIEMVSRADSVVTHDEADVSLMLDAARRGAKTVHILSDDTDVFVLMALCGRASPFNL